MAKISEPSVRSLFLQMRYKGTNLAIGTGFVAMSRRGPVLVTNHHNVTGRDPLTEKPLHPMGGIPNEIVITHNHVDGLGDWVNKIEPLFDNNDVPLWIEHPIWYKQVDFVALPLTQLENVRLYPYDLINTGPLISYRPASSLSVVGFPFGIRVSGSFAVWSTGFVASEPDLDYNDLPLFLIDCRTREGQSGSPVIIHKSGGSITLESGGQGLFDGAVTRFLGIYSGRVNKESDLGMVWKAVAIRELLNSIT